MTANFTDTCASRRQDEVQFSWRGTRRRSEANGLAISLAKTGWPNRLAKTVRPNRLAKTVWGVS